MTAVEVWGPTCTLLLAGVTAVSPSVAAAQAAVRVFGNIDLNLTYSKVPGSSNLAMDQGGFVKSPQVNLIVTLLQSQQVSVLGQVSRPGRYPVDGRRSVLDMLALAGGIGPDGGDVVTLIRKRDGKVVKNNIDIVELFRRGDMVEDFDLAGGDVLFVERAPRFYIYGEVQRPGPVRLERQMTVLQALSAGGGLTPRGTERGIRVKRRDASGKIEVLESKQDDLVQVDDVIYVKESIF